MEPPKQIDPQSLDEYLEVMSQTVFQTGMSWALIRNKWPGIREALHGFDPVRLATMGETEIDELLQDKRVIRHRGKLAAIAHNARALLDLEDGPGGFRGYLGSFGDFEALVKDLRKRFKFLGDFGSYYFLYVVKEPVPEYHAWRASRGRPPVQ